MLRRDSPFPPPLARRVLSCQVAIYLLVEMRFAFLIGFAFLFFHFWVSVSLLACCRCAEALRSSGDSCLRVSVMYGEFFAG